MEKIETPKNLSREEKFAEFNQAFDDLLVGKTMELPLSILKPRVFDDGTKSYTRGPIEVYRSNYSDKITIDDGNHRYYEKLSETMDKPGYQESDLDKKMVKVCKIIPETEW